MRTRAAVSGGRGFSSLPGPRGTHNGTDVHAHGQLPQEEARNYAPNVVLLEDDNRIKRAA